MRKQTIFGRALAVAATAVMANPVASLDKPIQPDLRKLVEGIGWTIVNRSATLVEKDGQPGVRLGGASGTGVAWLDGVILDNGTIELDLRGANVVQRSFLGVAFHGADDAAYDAVYFRPFNFETDDAARRLRAVQYVAHPTHTWGKLRQERPGQFEKPVVPVPDPDGWFHARIVLAWPKVSVFVDEAKEPCLVVEQLSDRRRGRIGLWVDVGSGEFANLEIR